MILNKQNNTVFYVGRKNSTNNNYVTEIGLIYYKEKLQGCRISFSNNKHLLLSKEKFELTTNPVFCNQFKEFTMFHKDGRWLLYQHQDRNVNQPFSQEECSIDYNEEYYD